MEDKILLEKLKSLENIKPNQQWVILTKNNIIGKDMSHYPSFINRVGHWLFQYKIAVAGLMLVCLTGGTFTILHNHNTVDNNNLANVPAEDLPANLRLAAQKLAELNLAASTKTAADLPAVIKDYAVANKTARQQVLAMAQKDPANAAKIVKSVGAQIQQIDATQRQVFADLGVNDSAINNNDEQTENPDKALVELLIADSKKSTLTTMQTQDLAYVQGLYNRGNYQGALEFYLSSSLSQ